MPSPVNRQSFSSLLMSTGLPYSGLYVSDFHKPPPGREPDDYDVISVTVQWLVGRIYKVTMAEGRVWRWSITSVFMQGMPYHWKLSGLDRCC